MAKLYSKKGRFVFAVIFSLFEAVLIALIVFSDLDQTVLCYSAVAAAFIAVFLFFFEDKRQNAVFLVASFLTLVSDFFLVIMYGSTGKYVYQCLGVTFFCTVHIAYAVYLGGLFFNRALFVGLRLLLPALVGVVSFFVLKTSGNYLSLASSVYFTLLLLNTVSAFLKIRKTGVFAVGLLFFVLCDLFLGLQLADGVFFTLPSWLKSVVFLPFNVVWVCYGVSQTLIALHVIKPFIRKKRDFSE